MKGKSFRVALLVPVDIEVAEGYSLCKEDMDDSGNRLFVSEWTDGIASARDKIDKTAQSYSEQGVKFLFFREIRKPVC
jgi:hypothetical protein